jgi:serine protease AprX
MPSSNIPPEEQQQVKPFDPVVLDRTVIAVPLLNEMKEDLDLIEMVEKMYPEAAQKFNAAIEFNKKFPGGAKAAREKVLAMAEDAKQAALEASKRRIENTAKEVLDVAQKRHDALLEGIEKQTIGPLQPKSVYSFALLHATIYPKPSCRE